MLIRPGNYIHGLGRLLASGFLVLSLVFPHRLSAQNRPERYLNGAYQVYTIKEQGLKFKVFDFNTTRMGIKAEYFGQNAGAKFQTWQSRYSPNILCYFAVGFAQNYSVNGPPEGLSIESGRVLNRSLDRDMDGIVEVSRYGQLSVTDIRSERVDGRYAIRSSASRNSFISGVTSSNGSVFQTQLLYSSSSGSLMGERRLGNQASRRFMAVTQDTQGRTHLLILDLVEAAHLNDAGQKALLALQENGFRVLYLLNHDTGSRNIMEAFDGQDNRLYAGPVDVSEASQLLVIYKP